MPKKLPKYCSDFEKQREWGRLLFTVYHQDYLIQKLSPILAAITLQETQLFANVRVSKNSRKLKGDSPCGRPVILRVSCFVPALPWRNSTLRPPIAASFPKAP